MGDPVVAGVDFVGDVQIPTIASASLTAACGQILNTVGSAAASAAPARRTSTEIQLLTATRMTT